ncbi:CYTH domain-containing protein [Acidipila sp. EB88]|nr:CYTH domain-containing protein [Acidipila sp. EB88]
MEHTRQSNQPDAPQGEHKSPVEIEVKFRVADVNTLQQRLTALGFQQQTPRTFEHNLLFDTPDHSLRGTRSILRIRRYGDRWVLTHKCLPPDFDPAERLKHRLETETVIEDGMALATVFERLGYVATFEYEKYRTEWTDGTGHCVIDETPIGLFAELEGSESWIDRQCSALRLAPHDLLTLSYGRLFEAWKEETGSAAAQLTFAECGTSAG